MFLNPLKKLANNLFKFYLKSHLGEFHFDSTISILAEIKNPHNFFVSHKTFVDKLVSIDPGKMGKIKIDYHTKLFRYSCLYGQDGKIIIGKNCSIRPFCYLAGYGNITIGNNVRIGPGVKIFAHEHNFSSIDIPIFKQKSLKKEVIIEEDIWIGANCVITGGTTIGQGCIIAVGAVVTKSVEPYSVVGGVPAKVIKKRK